MRDLSFVMDGLFGSFMSRGFIIRDGWLIWLVYVERLRIQNYEIFLLTLNDDEYDLNAGRFAHFSREPFVDTEIPLTIGLSLEQGKTLQQRVEHMVEWCAAQQTPWNFRVIEPWNVGRIQLGFSFADPYEAVMFKLTMI